MQGGDAELLAAGGDVLGSQHGGVGGGLVTVGLDLHTARDTGNGFAATGITQNISLSRTISKIYSSAHGIYLFPPAPSRPPLSFLGCACSIYFYLYVYVCVCLDEPEIGDVDEGIVEGGEDTSDAENEFTLADVGAEGDVLLGSTGGFLRRHVGVFWFGN